MPGVAGTLRDLAPVVQGLPQQLLLLGTRLAVLGAQAGLALQPSLPVAQSPSLDRGEGGRVPGVTQPLMENSHC